MDSEPDRKLQPVFCLWVIEVGISAGWGGWRGNVFSFTIYGDGMSATMRKHIWMGDLNNLPYENDAHVC